MLKKIYEQKIFVIILTIIVAIIISTYNFLINYNKLTMTLSLNYINIEKGLNPDGTRFNVFEIKSKNVLDKVLAKCNTTGMTVDELRSRIDVYEKVIAKTSEKVRDANISGKDFKYITNEYSISYSQKDKFKKNHTTEILEAIASVYKDEFKKNHTSKNDILEIGEEVIENYNKYEYIEIADLLTNKVEAMERYISSRNNENSAYRSKETSNTFTDILFMIQNFKNIEIEKYKAFVTSSALAKDKDSYIKKLSYNVDRLTLDRNKAINEVNFTKLAIEKYDPNITGVAFIPSIDKDDEFYMNRTKTGLDYLTKNAYDVGIITEKITKEIARNNYLIDIFSNTIIDEEETNRLKQVANGILQSLQNKLMEIEAIAIQTDNDYISYKTRDYIKFSIPENTIAGNISIRLIIKALFLGFILSSLLVILKEYIYGGEIYYEDYDLGSF